MENQSKITRVGVFYDGNYFLHVSNYYNYFHYQKSRISISGLHEFIRKQIAAEEETNVHLCQIVDAHYFRGRLSAQEASQKGNQLYYDRIFDDILMGEGVTTHYLPLKTTYTGGKQEKGIDVWLALEAFELAFYKRFDVLVLITSDGDYVPLVRKLNTLGTRVMVLYWEFEYTTDEGKTLSTWASQDLVKEATYPYAMHEIIDMRGPADPLIKELFVQQSLLKPRVERKTQIVNGKTINESEIKAIKSGYGFIKWPPKDLFFHYTSLIDADFNELREGDKVTFTIGKHAETGAELAQNVRLKEE